MHAVLRAIRTARAAAPRTPVKRIHEFSIPLKRASVGRAQETSPPIMKTTFRRQSCLRQRAMSLAIGAFITLPSLAVAAEKDASFPENVIEKSKQLQNRMSGMFRDVWSELRDSVDAKDRAGHSLSTASVDVREQNAGYTVRVSLPGRDIEKTVVEMVNGKSLRIFAPANGKSGPYEQVVVLDRLASGVKPDVEKRPAEHLIIVHLSKTPDAAEPAPESRETPPKPLMAPPDRWDRDILARMEQMRREMDEIFQQSVKDFGDVPDFKDLFDHSRFGSSVELQEEGGNYVVRAYLPDRTAEDVKVTIDDGKILKIEAKAEERASQEGEAMVMKRKSHYLQQLTLPGPIDADGLKVDRKEGLLIITVPKKTTDE